MSYQGLNIYEVLKLLTVLQHIKSFCNNDASLENYKVLPPKFVLSI